METSVSGFKVRGDWGRIVQHGEQITQALRELDADDTYREAFNEWDEWRPKAHEQIDDDLNEKTAEQAHTDPGRGERAGKGPNEDIRTAGEKLTESYEKLGDDTNEAVNRWEESINYVTRAADSAGRKAIRKVEDTVYKRVMTQLTPYYFDNELISANVQQTENEAFVLEVNVNEDTLKEQVAEILAEYNDEFTRWHVTTKKDTDRAAAAEGVDPPTPTDDDNASKFSTN